MHVERSVLGRSWRLRPCEERLALSISQRHGVPELVGRVLAGRGIGPDEAPSFLSPRLRDWLPDPSHLHDLDRAAERLADAVLAREPVGIVGDYDVDGATSTALLARYLRGLGLVVEFEIPDRMRDGYGPNARILEELAGRGLPAGRHPGYRDHRVRAAGPRGRAGTGGDRRRPPCGGAAASRGPGGGEPEPRGSGQPPQASGGGGCHVRPAGRRDPGAPRSAAPSLHGPSHHCCSGSTSWPWARSATWCRSRGSTARSSIRG